MRVYDQLRQILAALITGGAAALLYDIADCLACGNNNWKKLLHTGAVMASFVLVFAAGRASGAGLRLFFLLAVMGGVFLYHGFLHTMVKEDLKGIQQFLRYYTLLLYKNAVKLFKTR